MVKNVDEALGLLKKKFPGVEFESYNIIDGRYVFNKKDPPGTPLIHNPWFYEVDNVTGEAREAETIVVYLSEHGDPLYDSFIPLKK